MLAYAASWKHNLTMIRIITSLAVVVAKPWTITQRAISLKDQDAKVEQALRSVMAMKEQRDLLAGVKMDTYVWLTNRKWSYL